MTPEAQTSHTALDLLSGYSRTTIDLMKHFMSLSVGIIVVVATFHERLAKGAIMVWTLPLSTISLLGCVLCAMRVCFDLIYSEAQFTFIRITALTGSLEDKRAVSVPDERATMVKRDRDVRRYLRGTNVTFAVGVVAIVLFVLRNFFR